MQALSLLPSSFSSKKACSQATTSDKMFGSPKPEQDNMFFRDGDAGIVRYSMAGYGITVPCTRETLSQGGRC